MQVICNSLDLLRRVGEKRNLTDLVRQEGPIDKLYGPSSMKIHELRFFGSSGIKLFVREYFESREDLSGKVIVDIPAGTGYISEFLRERGATVRPFDIFPEFYAVDGITCEYADITERIPMEDGTADIVLCQEGIEHLPNQLAALQELNRVLKPGGILILTTPSISHLRARFSNLLTESELYKRLPPNELDALWHAEDGRMYFGHIFLLGIQRLRTLAVAAGFQLKELLPTRVSYSALLLGWLYPLIWLVNLAAFKRNMRKNPEIPFEEKKRVYSEIRRLNCSPTLLFGRHLFVVFRKPTDEDKKGLYVNSRVDSLKS